MGYGYYRGVIVFRLCVILIDVIKYRLILRDEMNIRSSYDNCLCDIGLLIGLVWIGLALVGLVVVLVLVTDNNFSVDRLALNNGWTIIGLNNNISLPHSSHPSQSPPPLDSNNSTNNNNKHKDSKDSPCPPIIIIVVSNIGITEWCLIRIHTICIIITTVSTT